MLAPTTRMCRGNVPVPLPARAWLRFRLGRPRCVTAFESRDLGNSASRESDERKGVTVLAQPIHVVGEIGRRHRAPVGIGRHPLGEWTADASMLRSDGSPPAAGVGVSLVFVLVLVLTRRMSQPLLGDSGGSREQLVEWLTPDDGGGGFGLDGRHHI